MVRSLVINPHEDMRTWLKYASLCGKSGRLVREHPFLLLHFLPRLSSNSEHAVF